MRPQLAALVVLLCAWPAGAQAPPASGDARAAEQPSAARVIRLTVRPTPAPVPALKYRLVPELREFKPGNAVTAYYRAFSPEWQTNRRPEAVKHIQAWEDLTKPPPAELRWVLHWPALREIEAGTRRTTCDWEMLDRIRKEGIGLLMPDIQSFREYGTLLAARARFEMADGRHDKAAGTLETGVTFARHVGDAPTLIQALVGAAVAETMLTQADEFVQTPGSPNLYWALSDLPRPFIDMRKPLQGERLIVDNLFPGVREMIADPKSRPMSEAEVRAKVEFLAGELHGVVGRRAGDPWMNRLGLGVMVATAYPEARRFLLAQGRAPHDVDAMPATQAVLMLEVFNYDRHLDEVMKWQSFPYWQARAGLAEAERRLKQDKARGMSGGTTLATLLMPAVARVQLTSARTDRRIAALRCVEAIRLYAAGHDGQLPKALADITEVPVPDDPITGTPFAYTAEGDTATLDAPAPRGAVPDASNSLRYVLTLKR